MLSKSRIIHHVATRSIGLCEYCKQGAIIPVLHHIGYTTPRPSSCPVGQSCPRKLSFDFTNCRAIHSETGANSNSEGHQKENTKSSSIDPEEVDKFSRIAQEWWKAGGEFDALHSLNELRIPLIRDGLLRETAPERRTRIPRPLEGLHVMDVGCGGGILSEPIARLGANVTGLDASSENIEMAKWHARSDHTLGDNLTYLCSGVEELTDKHTGRYDAVVASEILEHVANQEQFVATCSKLVKRGGSLFVTTLNKTWLSHALGIVAAERLFRIVPEGAHDWDKFIDPDTVQTWLEQCGFHVILVHGMLFNPLTNRWRWISDTSINYAIHAVKVA